MRVYSDEESEEGRWNRRVCGYKKVCIRQLAMYLIVVQEFVDSSMHFKCYIIIL